jgi:hypothetical protein
MAEAQGDLAALRKYPNVPSLASSCQRTGRAGSGPLSPGSRSAAAERAPAAEDGAAGRPKDATGGPGSSRKPCRSTGRRQPYPEQVTSPPAWDPALSLGMSSRHPPRQRYGQPPEAARLRFRHLRTWDGGAYRALGLGAAPAGPDEPAGHAGRGYHAGHDGCLSNACASRLPMPQADAVARSSTRTPPEFKASPAGSRPPSRSYGDGGPPWPRGFPPTLLKAASRPHRPTPQRARLGARHSGSDKRAEPAGTSYPLPGDKLPIPRSGGAPRRTVRRQRVRRPRGSRRNCGRPSGPAGNRRFVVNRDAVSRKRP